MPSLAAAMGLLGRAWHSPHSFSRIHPALWGQPSKITTDVRGACTARCSRSLRGTNLCIFHRMLCCTYFVILTMVEDSFQRLPCDLPIMAVTSPQAKNARWGSPKLLSMSVPIVQLSTRKIILCACAIYFLVSLCPQPSKGP